MNARKSDTILRYTAGTRINHWIVADQLRAARVVGACAVSPRALLVDQSVRRRTLDEDLASLHRGLHGRGVLSCCGASLWRDNYMQQRDWIWLKKINDEIDESRGKPARGGALQRRAEAAVLHDRRVPDRSAALRHRDLAQSISRRSFPIGVIRLASLAARLLRVRADLAPSSFTSMPGSGSRDRFVR